MSSLNRGYDSVCFETEYLISDRFRFLESFQMSSHPCGFQPSDFKQILYPSTFLRITVLGVSATLQIVNPLISIGNFARGIFHRS